jgi:hypothetical protein
MINGDVHSQELALIIDLFHDNVCFFVANLVLINIKYSYGVVETSVRSIKLAVG